MVKCILCYKDATFHMVQHVSPMQVNPSFKNIYSGHSYCEKCWKKIESLTDSMIKMSEK